MVLKHIILTQLYALYIILSTILRYILFQTIYYSPAGYSQALYMVMKS
jgi:membrane associated rhomboid family serine protease